MTSFQSLGLSEPIVRALTELSITEPTPIQAQAIPMLVDEAVDFLGLAQTGTGKTAAFGLPLLEQIDPNTRAVQAIVLSPTRELAQQICTALQSFSKYMKGTRVGVVYGGTSISAQIKEIRTQTPHILVATPGRMIDLIDRKVLNLSNVSFVVLDEADEMLNMGFKEDIDTILSFTQHDKNTWLFSATMPKEIRSIVNKYMHEPREVSIKQEERVNENIEHRYALVHRRDKRAALKRIIDAEGDMYALIFCRTKAETQQIATQMADDGYPVEAIHGDLSQNQRTAVMRKFKAGHVKLLAATDVAARGIDVDDLTHVVHFDLPDDLAFYTHRSGRTGRAGRKGVAISIVNPSEQWKINNLERQLKITFKHIQIPSADEVKMKNVQSRLDDILNTEATDDARMWVHTFAEQLGELTKEEFIAKYITRSLDSISQSDPGDLNAAPGSRGSQGSDRGSRNQRSDRRDGRRDGGRDGRRDSRRDSGRDSRKDGGKGQGRERAERSGKGLREDENMTTFEINVGSEDKIQKGDLLKVICDTTGVRSKHIGRIQLLKSSAKFDVEADKSQGVETAFKGLNFEGRPIQVKKK